MRIAKEDILRLLKELGGKATVQRTLDEVGESELAKKAVCHLLKDGLIRNVAGILQLTDKGNIEADKIYNLHATIERMLASLSELTPEELHKAAHSIEHLTLNRDFLTRLIKPPIRRLIDLEEGKTARVIAVLNPKPSIVSRLFGIGLLPGRTVRLVFRSAGLYIVSVSSGIRIVAIDQEVAQQILVSGDEYDKD